MIQMKYSELNFALIIAVLTIILTVVTKANPFKKITISRCFFSITLVDGLGSSATLDGNSIPAPTCAFAKAAVAAGVKYISAASISQSFPTDEDCDFIPQIFCCIIVTEGISTDPGVALSLDGLIPKKWHVASQADISCRSAL